jgi:hypothetical protein
VGEVVVDVVVAEEAGAEVFCFFLMSS